MLSNYARDRKIEYVTELILDCLAITVGSGIILFIGNFIAGHFT